jgi:uncharacterized protein YjbJ (UPF0337 family)
MDDRNERSNTEKGVEKNVRGTGNDMKGRAKNALGGLTGDNKMQAEGKMDRVKGKIQNTVGDIQRKIGEKTDRRDRP